MSDSQTNIPDHAFPLLDPNGRLHEVWWRFFVTLFNRTGNQSGGDLTALINLVNAQGALIAQQADLIAKQGDLIDQLGVLLDQQAALIIELQANLFDQDKKIDYSSMFDQLQSQIESARNTAGSVNDRTAQLEAIVSDFRPAQLITQQAPVTGSHTTGTAFNNLLAALQSAGLIIDNTTP